MRDHERRPVLHETVHRPLDQEIASLAESHAHSAEAVLELLVELQNRYGYLNSQQMEDVGRSLKIPPEKVYGIATFYSLLDVKPKAKNVIRVCDGPVCWLKRVTLDPGSILVENWENNKKMDCQVERSSCLGLCDRAPSALVNDEQAGTIEPGDSEKVCQGWRGVPTNYNQPRKGEVRVILAHAGEIDPGNIHTAMEYGAYEGLRKALSKKPAEVINEVEISGLQGRGGAGFGSRSEAWGWRTDSGADENPRTDGPRAAPIPCGI